MSEEKQCCRWPKAVHIPREQWGQLGPNVHIVARGCCEAVAGTIVHRHDEPDYICLDLAPQPDGMKWSFEIWKACGAVHYYRRTNTEGHGGYLVELEVHGVQGALL